MQWAERASLPAVREQHPQQRVRECELLVWRHERGRAQQRHLHVGLHRRMQAADHVEGLAGGNVARRRGVGSAHHLERRPNHDGPQRHRVHRPRRGAFRHAVELVEPWHTRGLKRSTSQRAERLERVASPRGLEPRAYRVWRRTSSYANDSNTAAEGRRESPRATRRLMSSRTRKPTCDTWQEGGDTCAGRR